MRLHRGLSALTIALGLAFGATSCETLSGSGKAGPELATYRQQLAESRAAMNRAIQDGDLQGVGRSLQEIEARFTAIESKGSAMNLLDREHVAIKIATGRRTIAEATRWIQVNDVEAVRSQVIELDPVLGEIDELLGRAARSSDSTAAGTS